MHLNALVFFGVFHVEFLRTAVGTVGRFMHLGRDPGGLWLSTPCFASNVDM